MVDAAANHHKRLTAAIRKTAIKVSCTHRLGVKVSQRSLSERNAKPSSRDRKISIIARLSSESHMIARGYGGFHNVAVAIYSCTLCVLLIEKKVKRGKIRNYVLKTIIIGLFFLTLCQFHSGAEAQHHQHQLKGPPTYYYRFLRCSFPAASGQIATILPTPQLKSLWSRPLHQYSKT